MSKIIIEVKGIINGSGGFRTPTKKEVKQLSVSLQQFLENDLIIRTDDGHCLDIGSIAIGVE